MSLLLLKIKNLIINLICYVTIDGHLHKIPYLVAHIWMIIQTLVCIINPNSPLYSVLMWADLSTFIPPPAMVSLCFVFVLTYIIALIGNFAMTDSNEMLKKPSTTRIYVTKLLAYHNLVGKSIIMTSILRSSLMILQNPAQFPNISYNLAIVNIVFYLCCILPLALFISSNSLVLTAEINKKLFYINSYLALNLMRVVFVVVSTLAPSFILVPMMVFLFLYIIFSLKQPAITFDFDPIIRGIIATVAYYCAMILIQTVHGEYALYIELVGLIFFIAFMNWVSKVRIRYILRREVVSIHQFKILLYLIYNIEDFEDLLNTFALHHYRICKNPNCMCPNVIQSISSKSHQVKDTKIWYKFVLSLIDGQFKHEQVIKMPQTKLKMKIFKYIRIVVDISQIKLFTLNKKSSAYYNLTHFSYLLKERSMFSLIFTIKQKIISYSIEAAIQAQYKQEGVINKYADQFIRFQIAFENYRKLLIKSAEKTISIWGQLVKKDPDQDKLLVDIKKHYSYQTNVQKMYCEIKKNYSESIRVLEPITYLFYNCVLNIDEGSPFNIVKKEKGVKAEHEGQANGKTLRLSENMECFSYSSNTPICFVSIHGTTFGQITSSNIYFNQLLNIYNTKKLNVQDFIIPQIKKHHQTKMHKFIEEDNFSYQHKHGYMLDTHKHLVSCKVMLQIVPSLEEGLKYVFFVKKLMPRKMILVLKNSNEILYTSEQFDRIIKEQVRPEEFDSIFNQNVLEQLTLGFLVKIKLDQCEYYLKMMHRILTEQDQDIAFVRFTQRQVQMDLADNLILQTASRIRQNQEKAFYDQFQNDLNPTKSRVHEDRVNQNVGGAAQHKHKAQTGLLQVYTIIENDTKCRNINKWHFFIILILIAFLALICVVIVNSQANSNNFIRNSQICTFYDKFLLTILRMENALRLQNLNAFLYPTNTTMVNSQFWKIVKYSDILNPMNNMAVSLPISQITQIWPTISTNANGSFSMSSQNNFLAISDTLQSPLTNIINNNPQSFSFSIYRPAIPTPYNSIIEYFWQATLNAIYITIPNLEWIKFNTINSIISSSVMSYGVIIAVSLISVVIMGAFVVISSWISWRIKFLKDQSYVLLEIMNSNLIFEKKKKSLQFCKSFIEYGDNEYMKSTNDIFAVTLSSAMKDPLIGGESAFSLANALQEETERGFQKQISFQKSDLGDHQASRFVQLKDAKQKKEKRKKKKYTPLNIFSKSNKKHVVLKYVFFILPILAFFLAFIIISVTTISGVTTYFSIQESILQMKENINSIHLYAFHLGVYEPQLSNFTNIPTYLNSLINKTYALQRFYINNINTKSMTGKTLNTFANQDICQLFAQYNVTNITDAVFNLTLCAKVSQGLLSKGYYPSLIGYLQSANTLLSSNYDTSGYNMTQRLAFYQSQFHVNSINLIPYLDIVNEMLITAFQSEFSTYVNNYQEIIVILSAIMILILIVMFIWIGMKIRKGMFQEIGQIKALFSLISYQTIATDEDLAEKMKENIDNYCFLK